jgi:DNA-binding Xre family transcriptional regulator
MKLHIHLNQQELSGFKNINVATENIDLGNLDSICGAAECTEIVIKDILRFMGYEQVSLVINHLASRLRHGGKMTLIFPDINSILRTYNNGEISEKDLNSILFNNGVRSCFSYGYIKKILDALNLNILKINISTQQVIIISERP